MDLVIDSMGNKSLKRLFRDIVGYRDLLWILAWRDYKVRYAQSALGVIWAFIQPIATLIIFSLVFGRVAKIDTGDTPYVIYAQVGMVAWVYFSFLLSQAGNSIIGAQNMIKKIYFPRLIIPLSKAVVGLIDFFISIILLFVLMWYYQYTPSSNIVFLPLFLLIVIIAGLGIGIMVSALTVRYRDFKHLLPFAVQLGLYATPIAYPASKVPEKYQLIYHLNPMAGVVEGFRWCVLGGDTPHPMIYLSLSIVLVLFISSIFYFQRVERIMADVV
jgi:lipopolysaccharide transport system permease protein